MSWTVKDHTADNGAPLGFGTPAAYTVADGHHCVYQGFAPGQGGDRLIHELYWVPGGGGWKLNELTSAAGGPAVLQTRSPSAYGFLDTQHVLYEGDGPKEDEQVHELYWSSGNGWGHNPLTSTVAGASPALDVAMGFAAASPDTQNVVYRDHNSHVIALTWQDTTSWSAVDLTVHAQGALTSSRPGGYVFSPTRTKQVPYIDEGALGSGHVHELLCDANGNWRDFDLHQVAAARGESVPAAVSDPTGYGFVGQQTKHVNFVGTDGQIHEFWWAFDTGWRHNILTGQPLPGGTPPPPAADVPVAGYVSETAMTQHLVYADAAGRLHELLWDAQHGWQHTDLAAPPTSAPRASTGGTSAYVYPPDHSQHVFYLDTDRHLIELWQD
jgi:hypothetical protein